MYFKTRIIFRTKELFLAHEIYWLYLCFNFQANRGSQGHLPFGRDHPWREGADLSLYLVKGGFAFRLR